MSDRRTAGTVLKAADTHVHLDAYSDRALVLKNAASSGVLPVIVTNRASEFRNLHAYLGSQRRVRLAIGLHPEMAGSTYEAHELRIFEEEHSKADWIAEIGLDGAIAAQTSAYFGSIPTLTSQQSLLERILDFDIRDKPMSLHSRGAERRLLDILEAAGVRHAVLHWFHGDKEVAARAVDMGFFFSINDAMLDESESDLVRWLPVDHLLFETDGPFTQHRRRIAEPADVPAIVRRVAALRGEDPERLAHTTWRSFLDLDESRRGTTVSGGGN